MIRIVKPNAPDILINRGAKNTKSDCRKFDRNRDSYSSGKDTFDFDNKIYGAHSVKQSLKKIQHKKCCFCEGKSNAQSYGDVEHFRPKGAVKQDKSSNRLYPGYYWLTYCWNNLYFSCQICNGNKSTLFPLENPNFRARSHHDDVADEKPLLIDPGGTEDPRSHISFVGPRAKPLTKFGKITIETVDLNRNDLLEDRLALFANLKTDIEVVEFISRIADDVLPKHSESLRDEIVGRIKQAIKPTAKYSSMATNSIPNSMLKHLQD